jgi:hypothetical protein
VRTLAQEIASFERLKPRLVRLWHEVFPRDDEPYTSIVVPSLTLDPGEVARDPGLPFYEEVLLFLLIRLRNPHARVVYVTSQPIPGPILDYYLHFLAGIPASHAAARLSLLSAYDGSPRPLAEKILERPRLLARIRAAVDDPARAYLTVLRSTALERRLAIALDVPLNAPDPEMEAACGKSGARRLLQEAGLDVPLGYGSLRDEDDLLDALEGLRAARPGLRRAILKLDSSHWDTGDALLTLPAGSITRDDLRRGLGGLEVGGGETPFSFLSRFARLGGVVEEFIEGRERADASVQLRLNPVGTVFVTSTHDELRGGPGRILSLGSLFPADEAYRLRLQEAGRRVGRVLAGLGVLGRVTVQLLLVRDRDGGEWRIVAHDLSLGVGGATHPLLAVRFLAGGQLDPDSGLFLSPTGRPKYYRCTDRLASPAWRGLTPADVVEIFTVHRLNYSPQGESGALVYMLGAVSELGRLGMVAIGNSRDEAEAVYRRAVDVLDRECRGGVR